MDLILEEVYVEGGIEGWIEGWYEVRSKEIRIDKRKMAPVIIQTLIEENRVSEKSITKVVNEWLAENEE